MMIQQLKEKLSLTAQEIARKQGMKDLLEQQLSAAAESKQACEIAMTRYDKVQILLQKTSDFARLQAKKHIEDIVTSALSVVFGRSYRFSIELDVRGKQPIVEYWLESDGIKTQLKPPDYDRGGGVADVVSLALRLSISELSGTKGPLLLDEIGKHVSAEYAGSVAYFLKEYSQKFSRQIILITHNETLAEAGDVSLQVRQTKGISEVMVL